MLVCNLSWKPIRLEVTRLKKGVFSLTRGGVKRGTVWRSRGYWRVEGGGRDFPNFICAALHLCRERPYLKVSHPRTIIAHRVQIDTVFYTFLIDPKGVQEPQVLADHPQELRDLSGQLQAGLRKAVVTLGLERFAVEVPGNVLELKPTR